MIKDTGFVFGVFIGEHDNKIDAKGRLSIPADFRRELEEGDPKWKSGMHASMALVFGDHRRDYIEVYRIEEVMDIFEDIAKMSRGSRKREELQKLYAGQSQIASVDDTGRIVLTQKLRDKLGITDRAIVVGNGDTFKIMQPDTYYGGSRVGLREDEDYDPALDPSAYLPGAED